MRPNKEQVAALDEFGKHKNWELGFDGKVYWEDDNPDKWTVWQLTGGVNDREWTAIGRGDTPLKAIEAAIAEARKQS
jgi:hypothetical protein